VVGFWELKDIVVWAAYGMSLPNMLKFGSEVRFRRWHDNYIRCIVIFNDDPRLLYLGYAPPFFAGGRVVAAAEFVGNTLRQLKTLVIFSEFEAEDCAMWSDGTIAFKRTEDVRYWAYVEIRSCRGEVEVSKEFEMSQTEVFKLANTAVDYVSGAIRRQLKTFFENFYFLPRKREEFEHYYRIDEYDCIWEDEVSVDLDRWLW